jgi:cytochrome P450
MTVVNDLVAFDRIPKVSGFPGVEQVNNALKFVSPQLPIALLGWYKELGPIFRLPFPGVQVVVLGDEALFKEMLLNTQVFVKGPLFGGLRDLLGESVLIEDGDHWMQLRRVINKAFFDFPIERLHQIVAEQTAKTTRNWRGSDPILVADQARSLALDIIWRIMFETERDQAFKEELAEAFVQCVKFLNRASTVRLPHRIVPGYSKFNSSNSFLKQVFDDLVEETVARSDISSQSLAKALVQGYGSKELAISQLKTLVLAGHETTEITLSWILHFISTDQVLQTALKEEVSAKYVEGSALNEIDFPLLTATITEALRLHPTTFIIPRQSTKEAIVGKYIIPADAMLIASTLLVQRSSAFNSAVDVDDADTFNPYRFIQNPALYQQVQSFGYGPRKCLGANFAMEELKQIVAYILKHFSLHAEPQSQAIQPYNVGGISRPSPSPVVKVNLT